VRLESKLDAGQLAELAAAQLNNFFPDGNAVAAADLLGAVQAALPRIETCFSEINNRYFFNGSAAVFDHLHGDQYAMWLYFLANSLYRGGGDSAVCAKLFLLNKALHGCDIYYEVALPDIFLLVHPLGTVLGRGNYSDYFVAYQRCGVGSNRDIYPSFGKYVTLRPGSAVLGNSNIGENCQIASDSLVLDRHLADNSLYIGNPKNAFVKPQKDRYPLWR
jgi:serine O-acetyltransferase